MNEFNHHTSSNALKLLARLWLHIRIIRRRQLGYLVIVMVLASFAEVLSIGAVLPFLALLTAPEKLSENEFSASLMQFFDISNDWNVPLAVTVLFVSAALFAGLLRLILLWGTTRLAFQTGADLSSDIYQSTLYQSYETHISRNSSEVVNGVTTKANAVILNVIVPLLFLISSLVLLLAIVLALVLLDPVVFGVSMLCFGGLYGVIARLSRQRLRRNGSHIALQSSNVVKLLQEGLGSIRDIIVNSTQEKFCSDYSKSEKLLRTSQGDNIFLSQSPRFAMESLGMALIGCLAYFLTESPEGAGSSIPVLGAMALGAQRALPLLQRIYLGWSSLQGGMASLRDILDLLEQPNTKNLNSDKTTAHLDFKENIELDSVSFTYQLGSLDFVINDVKLVIPKGSRVGVVGPSGSGKSTLIDLIVGLLRPSEGTLKIDGKGLNEKETLDWQSKISYVSQNIFLSDSSFAENIAYGLPVESIDLERVRSAATKAKISETIEKLPEGYYSRVGERGNKLSGGQKQRLGLARALYRKSELLVLDEATSALDSETEREVIEAVRGLSHDLTVVMIAHRTSTLAACDMIIKVENGRVGLIKSACCSN